MSRMTIVWSKGDDGYSIGAEAKHFIAIWGEPDDSYHYTACVPPEWQPLADAIEDIVSEFKPIRPIWEWPELEPVAE